MPFKYFPIFNTFKFKFPQVFVKGYLKTIVSKKPSKFCRCNVCQQTTCRLTQDASVKLPLEKMPL